MEFSNQITIARPVHEVFAFVSDLENTPKWNYAIVETHRTTDGPVGVGSEYRQVRSVPSRSEETIRVTEFAPDRRLSVHGHLGPFVGTLSYAFEEIEGGTRLTNVADLEAQGLSRLAAPLATGRVRDAVAANLSTLKILLEQR